VNFLSRKNAKAIPAALLVQKQKKSVFFDKIFFEINHYLYKNSFYDKIKCFFVIFIKKIFQT
jgi:hypothetical protein